MTHDQLVAAVGSDAIERVIECEDLFKGCIALLADRAVHVEERLGAAVVKGSYAYGPAEITINDEFNGTKELRLRLDGQSLRFAKLLPADADELARRFSGGARKAPEPVAAPTPEAPPAPRVSAATMMQDRGAQPRAVVAAPVQPASTAVAFSFKPSAIDAAKIAGVSALVALVARAMFPWSYDSFFLGILHALVVWISYGAATALLQRAYAPIMIRYALGAVAIEQAVLYLARFIGYGSFIYLVESAAVWAVFSVGYFTARGSKAPWQHAAAVGGAFGFVHQSGLRNLFGYNTLSVFAALFLFWFVQLLAERHPDSPLRG